MNKKRQKSKGITLIALVITIIVLLILAGVTIATLFGDNGILTKATEVQSEQADATVKEAIGLAWNEYQMMINDTTGKVTINNTKIASTTQVKIQGEEKNYLATPTMTFWQFLEEEKHYINEQGVIDVKALVGDKLSKGNGTDGTTDVYKIEETEEGAYVLVYYGKESDDKKELATFTPGSGSGALEETDPNLFEIENGVISVKDWDNYYNNRNEWTVENVVIPSEINGEKVMALDYNFMSNNYGGFANVKTVIIPDGVKIIGSSAFHASNIETIIIPNSVIEIRNHAFYECNSIEKIIIPNSVVQIERDVFSGWQSTQTIYVEFKVSEIPNTWDINCFRDCDAKRVFGYDPDYLPFAQEYLENKNQEELEELVLKTVRHTGTFDEFLADIEMTREELEQQASDEGMSYIEWLKEFLIYGDNSFSWVQVEFEVSKQGGTGKTVEELETLLAQKNGEETFEDLLTKENMTKEQFLEVLKSEGYRSEEDFLKFIVYYY